MPVTKRFFLGSLGALAPLLIGVLTIDVSGLLSDVGAPEVFGIVARVLAVLGLGGIAAIMAADENSSPRVVVHLGMTWPAVLTAGGIGLEATHRGDELQVLAQTIESYEAERTDLLAAFDTLETPAQLSSHVEHLNAIPLMIEEVDRSTATRFFDGAFGRLPVAVRRGDGSS